MPTPTPASCSGPHFCFPALRWASRTSGPETGGAQSYPLRLFCGRHPRIQTPSSWARRLDSQPQPGPCGPHSLPAGQLCMPPPRQGWPHSTVKNNTNNSSLCGSLHFTTHALSHWSFSEVFRSQPLFSFRAEEAEVCWGVTSGRVALGPRPLHLSPGFSAVRCFGVGWREQERCRASEPTAVDSGGSPPHL